MKSKLVLMMLLLATSLAFAAQTVDLPFGPMDARVGRAYPFSSGHDLGICWHV